MRLELNGFFCRARLTAAPSRQLAAILPCFEARGRVTPAAHNTRSKRNVSPPVLLNPAYLIAIGYTSTKSYHWTGSQGNIIHQSHRKRSLSTDQSRDGGWGLCFFIMLPPLHQAQHPVLLAFFRILQIQILRVSSYRCEFLALII